MRLLVNGKEQPYEGEATVLAFLTSHRISPDAVAVAVNGEIVPRQAWAQTPLKEGDEVEVVHVVAGGSGPSLRSGLWPVDRPYRPEDDPLIIADKALHSRLILGSSKYPSSEIMKAAWEASGTQMVTVAIRYMNLEEGGASSILSHIDRSRVHLLPNTAGAKTVQQAVRMAHLSREATGTNWIKLEVIGDDTYLWPDVAATIEATKILVGEGFVVLPYTSHDLVTARRLEEVGAATVMPLASPIGSGQGFIDWVSIKRIIDSVNVPVIVDAGIGTPSDAAIALELGAAAVLTNTAVAKAKNPVLMAEAMKWAVISGRMGYLAGRIPKRETAEPSSPPEGIIAARASP